MQTTDMPCRLRICVRTVAAIPGITAGDGTNNLLYSKNNCGLGPAMLTWGSTCQIMDLIIMIYYCQHSKINCGLGPGAETDVIDKI